MNSSVRAMNAAGSTRRRIPDGFCGVAHLLKTNGPHDQLYGILSADGSVAAEVSITIARSSASSPSNSATPTRRSKRWYAASRSI